ncbi:MAG: D-alanyl-D-alanine carboxypeptidase [Clostridia bacterium]|nr:D-alanyl-D-alanine carboxypeptidase [Clostridia bacterium]
MKKTAFFLITVFLFQLVFGLSVFALPDISAKSAVVIDAQSGKILYAKDAHSRRGMASTTKIMTALVALENSTLETLVRVDPRACGVEGSSVYLFENERITMEALLYALMLQSANDAAEAIAYAICGEMEDFVALMNQKADEMGLVSTHFDNPHGLDGETHYTTAYELALIAAEALENEIFAEIVSTVKKAIPLHNGEATRLLVNHNRLLKEYDDIIGVKTGYTKKCGRTLVSAAQKDGVRLICVTLDDGNDWADHRNLLDYGFSLYADSVIADAGEFSYAVPVCGAEKSSVCVKNQESLSAVLPTGHGEIMVVTELPRFLYAGIEKGEAIGKNVFYADGVKIGEVLLYAQDSAPIHRKEKNFWKIIFSFLYERKRES